MQEPSSHPVFQYFLHCTMALVSWVYGISWQSSMCIVSLSLSCLVFSFLQGLTCFPISLVQCDRWSALDFRSIEILILIFIPRSAWLWTRCCILCSENEADSEWENSATKCCNWRCLSTTENRRGSGQPKWQQCWARVSCVIGDRMIKAMK